MTQLKTRKRRVRIRSRLGRAVHDRPRNSTSSGLSAFEPGYRYEVINGVLVVSPYAGPGEAEPQ